MSARTPEDIHRLFRQCFTAADLDGLVALYERDAVLVPEPGETAVGPKAIREALQGFVGMGGRFELGSTRVVATGDVAILYASWTLSAKSPDGNPVELAGTTTDVVRRQADGSWLIVIDNPWGVVTA